METIKLSSGKTIKLEEFIIMLDDVLDVAAKYGYVSVCSGLASLKEELTESSN